MEEVKLTPNEMQAAFNAADRLLQHLLWLVTVSNGGTSTVSKGSDQTVFRTVDEVVQEMRRLTNENRLTIAKVHGHIRPNSIVVLGYRGNSAFAAVQQSAESLLGVFDSGMFSSDEMAKRVTSYVEDGQFDYVGIRHALERELFDLKDRFPELISGRNQRNTDDVLAGLLRVYTNGISERRILRAALILADSSKTVALRLSESDDQMPFPSNVSANDLAQLIGCSKSPWWKENRAGRDAETHRRRELNHRNRAKGMDADTDG